MLDPAPTLTGVLEYLGHRCGRGGGAADAGRRGALAARRCHEHRTTPDPQASIGRFARDLDPALLEECERRLGDAIALFGYPCTPAARVGPAFCVIRQGYRLRGGILFRQPLGFILCLMQRVLARRYAERDVPDVETYVRETVSGLASVRPEEEEALVAKGIFLVRRIAFALPPEASLQEALRERFVRGPVRAAGRGRPPAARTRRHRRRRVAPAPPEGQPFRPDR